jgi:hypothetical protein
MSLNPQRPNAILNNYGRWKDVATILTHRSFFFPCSEHKSERGKQNKNKERKYNKCDAHFYF